jgi:FixJ family two-component response regulator
VSDTDLLRAIRSALEHAAKTNAVRSELGAIHLRVERLTPREREVMMLVVTGILNKQVAEELGTVVKAIKAHRARVMEKIGACQGTCRCAKKESDGTSLYMLYP